MAEQGIGPSSFAVNFGQGQAPMSEGNTVGAINPSNVEGSRGPNLTALAPGGDFARQAAMNAEAMESIAQFGKKIIDPLVEKKKQELFWVGVQRQAKGESVSDIKKSAPWITRILNDDEQTRGARFYRTSSNMSNLMTDFERNMAELAKMSPEEASKYMVDKTSELMTDDPETNAALGFSMSKFLPDLMRTQSTARYKHQEAEITREQFNYDQSVLDRMASQQELLNRGEVNPEQFQTTQNALAEELLTRRHGENDEMYHSRITKVVTSSLSNGNYALTDLMRRSGAIGILPPDQQLAIQRMEDAAEGQAKQNFMRSQPERWARYTEERLRATTPQARADLDAQINAEVRVYSGAFTKPNFSLVDSATSQSADRVELVKAEAAQAEMERTRQTREQLNGMELQIYARGKNGEYGQGEAAVQAMEADRLKALQWAYANGIEDKDIPERLKSPISTFNQNWEAVEQRAREEHQEREKTNREEAKRREWNSDVANAAQNMAAGQDGVAMTGLDDAQKEVSFQQLMAFTDPTGNDIDKQVPVIVRLANGVNPYVNPRTQNILQQSLRSQVFNPQRVENTVRIFDAMLADPMGASAAERYFGKDMVPKILEYRDRTEGADIKEKERIYQELFNPTSGNQSTAMRRDVNPSKKDIKVAREAVGAFQPSWVWGQSSGGLPAAVNGGRNYEGVNLNLLETAYAEEYAYQRKTHPEHPEDRSRENAISSVRGRMDLVNQYVIRRPTGFPAMQQVLIGRDRALKWDPIVAGRTIRNLVRTYPEGVDEPESTTVTGRIENGKPVYWVEFKVRGNGGVEEYTQLRVTPEQLAEKYRDELFPDRDRSIQQAQAQQQAYLNVVKR